MNGHWCEGLDWIRADDIIEASPDLYVKLLSNLVQQFLFAGEGNSDTKKYVVLIAEMKRRAREHPDFFNTQLFADAARLAAEETARSYKNAMKILSRPNLRVVK